MKPHQLSDELEKFLHDQSVVGAAAWNRLFDETHGRRSSFEVGGETLPLEATLDLPLRHRPRRGGRRRRGAGGGLRRGTCRSSRAITNTLAKEKEIEDRWRKLPTPQAGRHLANDVEPEVVAGAARRGGRGLSRGSRTATTR